MKDEAKYLIVIYNDLPDTDFLCEYNGEVRLKVTKMPKNKFFEISKKSLCAVLDSCILVFEDIGKSIQSKEEILKAIFWYRNWLGEKKMYIINTD